LWFGYRNRGFSTFLSGCGSKTVWSFSRCLIFDGEWYGFLETAANPYITILGKPESSSQRLNFAQAFNGLGAFVATFFLAK